jgi:hypothetical protein
MCEKFILKDLVNNKEIKYNKLKDISKDLNIDYQQIRTIYQHSYRPRKSYHHLTKIHLSKYSIIDNPELAENLKTL